MIIQTQEEKSGQRSVIQEMIISAILSTTYLSFITNINKWDIY